MAHETPEARAHKMLKGCGYAVGGAVVAARRNGGKIHGDDAMDRPDRRARGGHVKPKIGAINIKVGGGEAERQQARQEGMQIGAKLGAAQAAPRPPMPPPHPMAPPMGPGGPPPGGAPGMPPGGPPMGGGMPPRPPQMVRRGGVVRRDEHGRWRGGVA